MNNYTKLSFQRKLYHLYNLKEDHEYIDAAYIAASAVDLESSLLTDQFSNILQILTEQSKSLENQQSNSIEIALYILGRLVEYADTYEKHGDAPETTMPYPEIFVEL